MRTHKEIFTEIYNKNIWGGSGGGSDPENTVEYRVLLQSFLKAYDIKTVLDWGCGDWAFSRLIDWSGVRYAGVDVVDSVVRRNIMQYANSMIMFFNNEIWPGGEHYDLIIVKDVLQHWSNDHIDYFLDGLLSEIKFKYILITNTASQEYDNQDIETGQTRGLCAKFEPLKKYNPKVLAVIETTITSEVLLIER